MKELGLNMKERKKLLGVMKDARDAEASGSRGAEKPPPPLQEDGTPREKRGGGGPLYEVIVPAGWLMVLPGRG